MYPHERSLVKKMQGQPFVMLGINTDPKEKAISAMKREFLNWRFWWDGGNTRGPIATQWNIQGWPTLYLLDHKGVIREKILGVQEPETLEASINALIKEIR